jgi:hypothetical protein
MGTAGEHSGADGTGMGTGRACIGFAYKVFGGMNIILRLALLLILD